MTSQLPVFSANVNTNEVKLLKQNRVSPVPMSLQVQLQDSNLYPINLQIICCLLHYLRDVLSYERHDYTNG